jgi:trans-aconitate methyltransferase
MDKKAGGLYEEQASRQFYEERYAKGYMDEWPPEKRRRVFEVVVGLGLPEEGEALDFGCGNGVFTEVIKDALPRWKIYGADVSAVAIENARGRVKGCTFFEASDQALAGKKFDFLFTHHVLEHVYSIDEVWRQIVGLMKDESAMLHILPCGNEGSLEYEISRLVRDGFDPEMENRFFFEDEGHVRRLDTRQFTQMAAQSGFKLIQEYYSSQYHGALNWITQNEPAFVSMMVDPSRAKDDDARKKLSGLRRKLMAASILRHLMHRVHSFPDRKRNVKRWIGLLAGLPVYPASFLVDRRMKRNSEAEWAERKCDPRGSEMYLYFTRGREGGA